MNKFLLSACALAASATVAPSYAQEAALDAVVVSAKRANRVSKGATGLALSLKDTPQTISTLDKDEIADFGVTGSNEALRMATGINVEQYETNRANFNARGFDVQLTQIDGLGMTNDWGTVAGQHDTFLFERIELIRGANGLLTGVGNASGTINYVRKRPLNEDRGEFNLSGGSYDLRRAALDVNKVFSQDGAWAGRLVVAAEDKDSHLRALHDRRSTVYGVVDGQIGDHGVLTFGLTYSNAKQRSPMWGSLVLMREDGTQAEFDHSASTAQDWTRWDTESHSAFIEYTHRLGQDWEAKLTYTRRHAEEDARLLYAYGALKPDNTGLNPWPYGSYVTTDNDLVDANVNGKFQAWGQTHTLVAGLSFSKQETETDLFPFTWPAATLPAFPYPGNVYPEPAWGPRTPSTAGEQKLTRFYAATRLGLTSELKAILGLNAVKLQRAGSSRYGNTAPDIYPDTEKLSPYAGLTYDFTPDTLGYVSYSDIFQNQDQADYNGRTLDPMKGVNTEIGLKSEWLQRRLLTTFAVFTAEQLGLATLAPDRNAAGESYYLPKDVKSRGFEFEASGRFGQDSRITVGYTHLKLTGPDGKAIYEWVPRTTINLRYDTKLLPALRVGVGARWQSDVPNGYLGVKQDSYLLANAFAAWQVSDAATLRVNVNNLFDKKYLGGLQAGAIYGAPRNGALTLDYKL